MLNKFNDDLIFEIFKNHFCLDCLGKIIFINKKINNETNKKYFKNKIIDELTYISKMLDINLSFYTNKYYEY